MFYLLWTYIPNQLVCREIYRLHKGNLPEVFRPECFCPSHTPHLSGSRCYGNEKESIPRIPFFIEPVPSFQGRGQTYLLFGEFNPEYIIDGRLLPPRSPFHTADVSTWFSAPGVEKFTVQIDLNRKYLVSKLIPKTYRCLSLKITLKLIPCHYLRQKTSSVIWWRIFGTDCYLNTHILHI